MTSVRFGTISPVLLAMQLTLACSVGTEVGNGVRPSDPNPPTTATNASSASGGGPDSTTADTGSTDTSVAASLPAPGTSVSGTAAGSVTTANTNLAFDAAIERIFVNCASPFGSSTIASPVVLSHKPTSGTSTTRDNKINASFSSGAQTWKITDANANLYRQLVLDQGHGAQAVIAFDAGFHPLNSSFTCGTVTTNAAATIAGSTTVYTKLSVNLTNAAGQIFPLSWYLLAPTAAGGTMQLKRIEIGASDNSAPFILEAE